MENFIINTPTVLHFGQDVIQGLGKTLAKYEKNVLFIYGKGSIKSNGIYQQVIDQLNLFDLQYVEYHGIKANPIIEDVDKAAELGKRNNVDVILAVGGGSVIDTAKIVSIAIPVKNPAWDFFEAKVKPEKSIPLISVLTFAGTGTEMNSIAVVLDSVQSSGTIIHIESESGEEILTYESPKDFQLFVFSSPEVALNTTYTLYVGGSATGTVTNGVYSEGTYTPGTQVASLEITGNVTASGNFESGRGGGSGNHGGTPPDGAMPPDGGQPPTSEP